MLILGVFIRFGNKTIVIRAELKYPIKFQTLWLSFAKEDQDKTWIVE